MFNGKRFVIADTHFGHRNIIKYCKRPFKDEDEMDEALISNWNSVVKDGHKIYMLGDFSMRGKEQTEKIVSRLNGVKTLIRGNHDTKSNNYYRSLGFDEVSEFPIIIDKWFILSHEPAFVNEHMPYVNIFGHVHDDVAYKDYSSQGFCVSAERINYTPIDYDIIVERIKNKCIKNLT